MKNIDFNDIDLRKLDLTRKYDDDFSSADGITWMNHLLLYTVGGLILFFILWANMATLEEVSRGDGKVIPSSEVQIIQNLEGGIVDEFLVAEGEMVKSGQVILKIRNMQAKSDFAATQERYLGLYASIVRLQAEADGKEELVFTNDALKTVNKATIDAELDAFAANRKEMGNRAEVLKQQMSQKKQEVAELRKRISDLKGIMGLSQDERNMVAPMVEKGAASRKELLQLDRQIAEQRSELNGLQLALPRAQSGVKEAEGRLAELENSAKAAAQKELTEKTTEMNTIKETLAAYKDKSERTDIRSPVTGTVKDIKNKTVGAVFGPGQAIMEIVPLEDQLIVEARIRPADIAFIHPGQKATVRLTAFDYSIYGSLEGEVVDISADTITNDQGESFYRVNVRTKETSMKKGNEELEIMPGMQASIDVITGEKTVMNYLLKPFNKAATRALRER